MSSIDKHADSKSSSRHSLLIAAERLFTEKGYAAVSTREIAEAAGVNLGAIQYHFGSKARLFVETVRGMMCGSDCVRAQLALEPTPSSKEDAMHNLGRYIHELMHFMLRPQGPRVCRMMFREILSETATDAELFEPLVETMVEQFIRPVNLKLCESINFVAPELNRDEQNFVAKSIVGQCSFYISHQPFVERLDQRRFADSPNFEDAVSHVFRFTMRALRVSDAIIERILPTIFEQPAH